MADKSDKINPTAKLPPVAAATNGGAKSQTYNAPRPMYRPKPPSRRRGSRSCVCCCCLWITFLVIILVLLVAGAGAIFWLIYRPQRPDFVVDSLQLSQLALTSSALTSKFTVSLSARNPNKKVEFIYDPISVSVFSGDAAIGSGTIPGFEHGAKNTTALKTNVAAAGESLDADQVSAMKSAIKNKSRFPVKITLDTKVKVKAAGLKTKRVGIRVTCDDIRVAAPAKKSPSKATIPNDKCNVDVRFKIWKWNF
ncbi:PREDICTED: protein YLS9-like [Ipomoea nil]|uniref:protein YLS9-like n=1 Tax=Ipomoea nil TaxID=35883 RepID=UPI000900A1D8|nr:PREDICTED: protein YLS9-like [Ipomoea nil]